MRKGKHSFVALAGRAEKEGFLIGTERERLSREEAAGRGREPFSEKQLLARSEGHDAGGGADEAGEAIGIGPDEVEGVVVHGHDGLGADHPDGPGRVRVARLDARRA